MATTCIRMEWIKASPCVFVICFRLQEIFSSLEVCENRPSSDASSLALSHSFDKNPFVLKIINKKPSQDDEKRFTAELRVTAKKKF